MQARVSYMFLAALALTLSTLIAAGKPPTVYSETPPPWYSLTPERGRVKIYTGLLSSIQAYYYAGVDPLENSVIIATLTPANGWGGPNGLFGEVGYNVYHVGRVHGFSTVSKRSGSYSYRLSVYSSGGFAWARATFTGASVGGTGSLYISGTWSASNVQYANMRVRVFVNGQIVYDTGSPPGSWTQVTFTVPQSFNVTVWIYVWTYSSSYTGNVTLYIDDVTLYPIWTCTPSLSGANATHAEYTVTNNWGVTLTLVPSSPPSCTAVFNGTTYTRPTAYPATIPAGGTGRIYCPAVENVTPSRGSYSFTVNAARVLARFFGPVYRVNVTPQDGVLETWFDAVNLIPAPGLKTVTVTLGDYVLLRVGQPVNVTVHYADGGSSRVQVSNHYIVDVDRFTWFNVSNRDGWLKVNPVQPSETLNVIVPPPRNSVSWVSFIVEDFGQNFTEVRLYTLDGKLAWRERLSPATRTATALLKQYDTYILSVSKPTWERAFGAFVVDRSMFTLVVPPVVEQLPPPPYATAVYNSTLKALIVDVTCRSYCTVKLRKHTLTGVNATATYTCSTGRCRFTWYTGDPVFEVEVVDETGRTSYRTFTGTPVELVKPATGWELYALNATLGPLARRWGVDVRTLLVVFASTAVFLSLCVAGYMDIACIATIAVSLLLQWRYGVNVYTAMVTGTVTLIGVLYAVSKRLR